MVLNNKSNFANKGAVLTIGNFDGVHVGHRELIHTVVKEARARKSVAILYTFSPHPTQFLFPEKNHQLLCSRSHSFQIIEKLNLDKVIVQDFNQDFSQLSPRQFIETCILPLKPGLLIVGDSFRFGAKGAGDPEFLKKIGEDYQFELKRFSPVKKEGQVVSSSLIKKTILAGDWPLVQKLLGRPFSIRGRPVSGEGRGKGLGFPTLNLALESPQTIEPVNGVYIVRIVKKDKYFQGVANIGVSPTFGPNRLKKIEVHLLEKDFEYTKDLEELEFLEYLRPEKKFSKTQDLIQQIQQDVSQASSYFRSPTS